MTPAERRELRASVAIFKRDTGGDEGWMAAAIRECLDEIERLNVLNAGRIDDQAALQNAGAVISKLHADVARLQARKTAPTRERVQKYLSGTCNWSFVHFMQNSDAKEIADYLAHAGLLAEPEREPGWYWCTWNTSRHGGAIKCPAHWDGKEWTCRDGRTIGDVYPTPDEIGPRIDGPPESA